MASTKFNGTSHKNLKQASLFGGVAQCPSNVPSSHGKVVSGEGGEEEEEEEEGEGLEKTEAPLPPPPPDPKQRKLGFFLTTDTNKKKEKSLEKQITYNRSLDSHVLDSHGLDSPSLGSTPSSTSALSTGNGDKARKLSLSLKKTPSLKTPIPAFIDAQDMSPLGPALDDSPPQNLRQGTFTSTHPHPSQHEHSSSHGIHSQQLPSPFTSTPPTPPLEKERHLETQNSPQQFPKPIQLQLPLLSSGLDPHLFKAMVPSPLIEVEKDPPYLGLVNLGNTCYCNAVLQCLRFTPGLSAALNQMRNTSYSREKFPLVEELRKMLDGMETQERSPPSHTLYSSSSAPYLPPGHPSRDVYTYRPSLGFRPSAFRQVLGAVNPAFAGYMQHDAQEFLRYLIGHLEDSEIFEDPSSVDTPEIPPLGEEVVFSPSNNHDSVPFIGPRLPLHPAHPAPPVLSPSQSSPGKRRKLDHDQDHEQLMTNPLLGGKLLMHALFEGELVFSTQCLECENVSTKREKFFDLSVPVAHEPVSLTHVLANMAGTTEKMSDSNKYFCEACMIHTEAIRKLAFGHLPSVLTIHLNRSSHLVGTGKIKTPITVPFELSLARWMYATKHGRPEHVSPHYQLYGLVFHSGHSSSSGHYVAYVRCPYEEGGKPGASKWVFFDDDVAKYVSDARVRFLLSPVSQSASTAYIAFYHRVFE